MAKKIKKENKYVEEIARLKQEVEEALYDAKLSKESYFNLKRDFDLFKAETDAYKNLIQGSERLEFRHVRDLMEIIRWQMNRDTAAYPFKASKEQRIEGDRSFNGQSY